MSRMLQIICFIAVMVCLLSAGGKVYHTATPLKIIYPDYFGNRIMIPADNPTTSEGVYLGRMLFYEKALSANNKISCATCHQQSLAFTDGKAFSAGVDGTLQPRNTMSLANLLWVRHFFWDGRATSLEMQAATPLTNTHEMGQSLEVSANKLQKRYTPLFRNAFGSDSITGDKIVKALAQFERTLVSANSNYDKYLRGEYQPTASELHGIALFYSSPEPTRHSRGAGCGHCHGGPKTFSDLFHNNGLDIIPKDAGREKITGQAYDSGRFRVVLLRNIALTAPYMHDGRFTTLEEVVAHYNEHVAQSNTLSPFLQGNSNSVNGTSLDLNSQEKRDLIAFLHMLTDSSFIRDKRFSNPFLN
ncbi:cytochrome c peroxidase [Chitinophaga niastensis]|uniref:Cytochrome c peroxidase n=1 Tax=Chitinophaga niastensis TaxID=536980 RepID=A0A2P8HHK6_CHINA|nr:cytochrome c peroxidase [Chitinophaga niastensis]PSL45703.1 cytochrome c peroxidase [Chitinophaga niastensis]